MTLTQQLRAASFAPSFFEVRIQLSVHIEGIEVSVEVVLPVESNFLLIPSNVLRLARQAVIILGNASVKHTLS